MLHHTFMHIQSIGAVAEQRIWEAGFRHWDAFSSEISFPLSGKRKYLSKASLTSGFYKDLLIDAPRPPANPFRADPAAIDRIRLVRPAPGVRFGSTHS
jgi:hypothetical protein